MDESEILNRNTGQCLTESEMIAYLSHTLPVRAQHTLELHLSECPFCSDALEGLEQYPSTQNLHSVLQELQLPDIQTQHPHETKIRILFPWRIAAAFLLVGLSIATLIMLKPDGESGIAEAPRHVTETPDRVVLPMPSKESKISQRSDANPRQTESAQTKSLSIEIDNSAPLDESTRSGVTTEDINALDMSSAPQESDADAMVSSSPQVKDNLQTAKTTQSTSAVREENEARTSQQVESLATVSKRSTSSEKKPNEYQAGIRAYESGQYKTCTELLDRNAVLQNASIREHALWTLAQCQLNIGDTTSALNSLEQVIRLNGTYQSEAKRALERLK